MINTCRRINEKKSRNVDNISSQFSQRPFHAPNWNNWTTWHVISCCSHNPEFACASPTMATVIFRLSGLEVYKNTCLCFSTQKLYAIYVFNSVQSNSKRFLYTSVHFNVGRDVTTFLDETFPGRWVGRGGPTAWPPRSPDLTPLDLLHGSLLRTLCRGEKFEMWLIWNNVSLKQLSL